MNLDDAGRLARRLLARHAETANDLVEVAQFVGHVAGLQMRVMGHVRPEHVRVAETLARLSDLNDLDTLITGELLAGLRALE
jgi:hypothetical protein